jgi:parallel beta-helix repeat protein
VTVHFTNPAQIIADPRATGVGIRTLGLLQADNRAEISELGRVSDNTFTGLDLAMQSSSNLGVVSHNTVTNNAIGITISNDFDDGVHQVTGNIVTENVSTNNQVGVWIASGTQNTITLNDLRGNSLAGLLFLANPGGAASTGNFFHQNKGANLVGGAGNSSF